MLDFRYVLLLDFVRKSSCLKNTKDFSKTRECSFSLRDLARLKRLSLSEKSHLFILKWIYLPRTTTLSLA